MKDLIGILSAFADIETNPVYVERTSLSEREADLVLHLRENGVKSHTIAAVLGVNPGRVAEVSTECHFPRAA